MLSPGRISIRPSSIDSGVCAPSKPHNANPLLRIDQKLCILVALTDRVCNFADRETPNVQRACERQQNVALQIHPKSPGKLWSIEDHDAQQLPAGNFVV